METAVDNLLLAARSENLVPVWYVVQLIPSLEYAVRPVELIAIQVDPFHITLLQGLAIPSPRLVQVIPSALVKMVVVPVHPATNNEPLNATALIFVTTPADPVYRVVQVIPSGLDDMRPTLDPDPTAIHVLNAHTRLLQMDIPDGDPWPVQVIPSVDVAMELPPACPPITHIVLFHTATFLADAMGDVRDVHVIVSGLVKTVAVDPINIHNPFPYAMPV